MSDTTAIVSNDTINHVTDSINVNDGFICTVDSESVSGKVTIANALSDAEPLTSLGTDHFVMTDIITTPGVRTNTGEVCTNVYIVTKDGNIYMSQSTGIARSAAQIVTLFNGDFGDGLETSVIEKKLRNGNTMKSLHFYVE